MAKEEDQLYVRIDGHDRVLNDLKAIEEVIKNIEEASKVLDEVRGIKEKAIDNIYSNVQELNERLESIDMEMPELEGEDKPEMPQTDMDVEVDSSVDEIHDELQNLQEELSQLGN